MLALDLEWVLLFRIILYIVAYNNQCMFGLDFRSYT